MIFQLHDVGSGFPDPALAEDDGFLAVGGDLSIERLLLAYRNGIFPWYNDDEPICWFSPHERCVIFPGDIYVSKSMKSIFDKKIYTFSFDAAFNEVIANCKAIARKDQPGTWITDEMEAAYIRLYEGGYAHSIEVWQSDELAGGMYGVKINDVFCGESMFSKKPNASKAAMIWLCRHSHIKLLDCQVPNDHLMRMGAKMIPREEYINILQNR